MIKKIFFFIIINIFMLPIFVNAADNAILSITTNTQTPIVGDILEVQINIKFNPERRLGEAHYVLNIDKPELYQLTDVLWTQTRGTYSVDGNNIYIDKSATSEKDAWQYGGPVILKFKVLKAGLANFQLNYTKNCSYYNGDKIYKQSFLGISIDNLNAKSNSEIGTLYIDGYTIEPTFNKNIYNYSVTVPPEVTSVNVVAKKRDETQTITGDGERVLVYGANRVVVTVKAQNGEYKKYTIMINREDNRTGNVGIKNVFVSSKGVPYNETTGTYDITVGKSSETIILTAQTNDPKAELIGTGQKKLNIGLNTFVLTVKSSKNSEKQYTVNVTRSDEEIIEDIQSTKIQNLKINNFAIDLSNDKKVILYGINKELDSLKLDITPESKTSTFEVIGNENLQSGVNIVTIKVNEINNETAEYKIIVYKNPSNLTLINNLDNIEQYAGELITSRTENSPSTISSPILKKISENNIKLYYNVTDIYNGLLYQINLKNLETETEIDTSFTKTANTPLTYKTSLPANLNMMLYVGDTYQDNTVLRIYTYDEIGNYTLLTEGVSVNNGYINFTTNGITNYVFTTSVLIKEPTGILKFINKNKKIFIFAIPVILLLVLLPKLLKKKKKTSEVEEY